MKSHLNSGWIYRDRIGPKDANSTVLDYYSRRYRHSDRDTWRDRIETQQIYLGDRPATADQRLITGQELQYHRPPWHEPPVPLDFQVLYEDRDLLIVSKPAGLPVMPAGGFLEHTLLHQLQLLYPRKGNTEHTPIPIHRLGRGTSGLMILARSPLARSRLTQQMRDRQLTKIYWALATGCPPQDQFTITTPIGKLPHPTLGHLYGATPTGKFAHSTVSVRSRYPKQNQSLVEVSILTGRPHQIRIHLAAAGFPLVQDPLYQSGGTPRLNPHPPHPLPGDCGYGLHAHCLTFTHPRSDRPLTLKTPPPSSFLDLANNPELSEKAQ